MQRVLSNILGLDPIEDKPPELIRDVDISNRILKMDSKIREVINYLEMYQNDENISPEILRIAIDKLGDI